MRVTAGASQAIFGLPAGVGAEELRDRLDDHLRTHLQLKFATFLVDITAAQAKDGGPKSLDRIREELIAKNRYRQMRGLAVVPPEVRDHAGPDSYALPCEVDFTRSAVAVEIVGDDRRRVSRWPSTTVTTAIRAFGTLPPVGTVIHYALLLRPAE